MSLWVSEPPSPGLVLELSLHKENLYSHRACLEQWKATPGPDQVLSLNLPPWARASHFQTTTLLRAPCGPPASSTPLGVTLPTVGVRPQLTDSRLPLPLPSLY